MEMLINDSVIIVEDFVILMDCLMEFVFIIDEEEVIIEGLVDSVFLIKFMIVI